ncbi:MAG: 6-carboxytetrahydropterin synthase [Flavobacteriales bacterium]|nr:6-carboxytetrahydropterin synthase [Flavobacteriales bacterium]
MRTAIIRKEHFNAAHRLHNSNWSEAKNKEVFGKCNNPNFHGHNYQLEVKVIGDVDPETGYVMDVKVLKSIIRKNVLERYDHKNLNLDVSDFKNLNPTVENIAQVVYTNILKDLPEGLELKIRLYETERNIAEYPA